LGDLVQHEPCASRHYHPSCEKLQEKHKSKWKRWIRKCAAKTGSEC
jgi:hypothetical protein